MVLAALALMTSARADDPCATFYAPTDVVEAAMRVIGARQLAGGGAPTVTPAPTEDAASNPESLGDEPPPFATLDGPSHARTPESDLLDGQRRALLTRLSCVSEPLSPEDAAAVHLALTGEKGDPLPPPKPKDAEEGPPHPDGGVALVDGVAFSALPAHRAAVVQAFDHDGHVVYTRWLDGDQVDRVRGGAKLPDSPTVPRLAPVPLHRSEITRLVVSSALVVTSGALFAVAAGSRADWYAIDPSPVTSVEDLERLRVRTNVAQGAGFACAGLGAAGLLSVAVRVPF
jgi:hypothetical protein